MMSSKIIAITGASSGIGRATARLFGQRGWSVASIARGADGLASTRLEVEALGARVLCIPLDVTDEGALDDAATLIERDLGLIDVWVNNAVVATWGEFLDISSAEFRRVTEVGYFGYVNGTRTALKRMKTRDSGTIVQVGSMICYVAAPLQSAYSGVKHAIRGFTDAVRAELIHSGSKVHLALVMPASINTPLYETAGNRMRDAVPRPVPPVFEPELVATAIYCAVTQRKAELFVGGIAEQAAAMKGLAPRLVSRLMSLTYSAQRRSGRQVLAREGNLFRPSSGGHKVSGAFGRESFRHSAQLSLRTAPGLAGTALLGAGAVLAGAVVRRLKP